MKFDRGSVHVKFLEAPHAAEALSLRTALVASIPNFVIGSDRLEVIQQTQKSEVYRHIYRDRKHILKFFTSIGDYDREVYGYLLFRGGPIPALIYRDRVNRMLAMDELHGIEFNPKKHSKILLMRSVANMHNAANVNVKRVAGTLSRCYGEQLARTSKSNRQFLEACVDAWGPDHVPLAIGDLKPEHILVSDKGCGFVDLETVRVGLSEVYDILCLLRLLSSGSEYEQRILIEAYCGSLASPICPRYVAKAIQAYPAAIVKNQKEL